MIILPVGYSIWNDSRREKLGLAYQPKVGWLIGSIGLAALNLMLGPTWSSNLIYWAGEAGSAVVTGTHGTGAQYNNHDVTTHMVLIRTSTGKVMETRFEDDDFNVYPSRDAVGPPGDGDVFTVRYLAHAPTRFVVVADDASPWAQGLRCGHLQNQLADARSKLQFAPGNAAYKSAVDQARQALQTAACTVE